MRQNAQDKLAEIQQMMLTAERERDAILAKAKQDCDALTAEGARLRDEAATDRSAAARELAVANDDRKQLASEREAAARLGERHEASRQKFEAGFGDLQKVCREMEECLRGIGDLMSAVDGMRESLDRREAIIERAVAIVDRPRVQ